MSIITAIKSAFSGSKTSTTTSTGGSTKLSPSGTPMSVPAGTPGSVPTSQYITQSHPATTGHATTEINGIPVSTPSTPYINGIPVSVPTPQQLANIQAQTNLRNQQDLAQRKAAAGMSSETGQNFTPIPMSHPDFIAAGIAQANLQNKPLVTPKEARGIQPSQRQQVQVVYPNAPNSPRTGVLGVMDLLAGEEGFNHMNETQAYIPALSMDDPSIILNAVQASPEVQLENPNQIISESAAYYGTESSFQRPSGFLEGMRYDFTVGQGILSTKELRGNINVGERIILFGAAAGSSVIDTALGIKSLFIHPIQTIESIPSSIKTEAIQISQNINSGMPEIALGRVTGFYVAGKGIEKGFEIPPQTMDVIRTAKTIDIPKTDIIAPEYFAGETYPQITKGQSAGELLKEFQGVQEQYGVTQLRGFTASPQPFKSVTETLPGSSEIAGLYQAPKLSPHFLQITKGEEPTFSLNPFETMRPSAIIVTPKAFELTPYVKYSQETLAPLGPTKEFFSYAAKGKSFVPFVKTEKEAIIPQGTPLVLTAKRFSFAFENRRIPIYEFDIGDLNKVTNSKELKIYSTEDISKMSSYKIGRAKYSSGDILKLSYRSSYISPSKSNSNLVSYSKVSSSISPSNSLVKSSLSSRSSSVSKTYSRISYSKALSSSASSITSYKSYTPKSYGGYYPYPKAPSFKSSAIYPQYSKQNYMPKNLFRGVELFVKEKGIWNFKGLFSNPKQASQAGQFITGKDISRSFRIFGGQAPLPQGYRYSRKKGQQDVFVELSKTSLSQPGEKYALKLGKAMKGGYRKKRR